VPVFIDYDDHSVYDYDLRQQHKRAMSMKPCTGAISNDGSVHIYIGREDVIDGTCPKCGGAALLGIGYAWTDFTCKDYICWRTHGTLCSE